MALYRLGLQLGIPIAYFEIVELFVMAANTCILTQQSFCYRLSIFNSNVTTIHTVLLFIENSPGNPTPLECHYLETIHKLAG